ncbi:endonuclease III, partial [Streptococcus uberis]|nr:endonuclease III [Streptococcus uberis]
MKIGKVRLKKIMAIIADMFPEAKGELEWEKPYQLLIAVILSAQTTDK